MRFCECGCGGEVKKGRRFVWGHSSKGHVPWNKGLTNCYTEEHKRKISESLKGKSRTEETKRKISEALKGQIPWNTGKHRTEETRRKLSEAMKGKHHSKETRMKISETNKGHQIAEETKEKIRKKVISARKRGCYNQKPTAPEKKFMRICAKYNLPYKYVGDGKFWVECVNPDFVESNGRKIAVEIYGDYWHNLPKVIKRDKQRETILGKYGWKLLVLWEHEINTLPETEIVQRVSFGQRW